MQYEHMDLSAMSAGSVSQDNTGGPLVELEIFKSKQLLFRYIKK